MLATENVFHFHAELARWFTLAGQVRHGETLRYWSDCLRKLRSSEGCLELQSSLKGREVPDGGSRQKKLLGLLLLWMMLAGLIVLPACGGGSGSGSGGGGGGGANTIDLPGGTRAQAGRPGPVSHGLGIPGRAHEAG